MYMYVIPEAHAVFSKQFCTVSVYILFTVSVYILLYCLCIYFDEKQTPLKNG